jgi:putative zinc finger/helix-turn-helix YgiT family protein
MLMSKSVDAAQPQTPLSRPFPWKCGHCRQRAVNSVTIPYTTEIDHDGRIYTVTVPALEVPRCENCGELVLDTAANRQISAELRRQLGLLTPEEIRRHREALGLTQKQLASELAVAEATLSRWETGAQIQQRSLDRWMRSFFAFPDKLSIRALNGSTGNPGVDTTTSESKTE